MTKPRTGRGSASKGDSPPSKSSAIAFSLGLLPPDWCALLNLLNCHRVRFLLVGAHALAVHGVPRATADLDLLVEPSKANALRLARAIREFGFDDLAVAIPERMAAGRRMFRMGIEPLRIDVMNGIDGVSFDRAWANALKVRISGITVRVLGLRELRDNKRAAGRLKDLADLEMLAKR